MPFSDDYFLKLFHSIQSDNATKRQRVTRIGRKRKKFTEEKGQQKTC